MRIGILGGTFDPVHKGHLHLARSAQRRLRLDRVYFVPAYLSPHKAGLRASMSPARFRYAMLKLALAGRRYFRLSAFELKKRRKVYTIETVRAFRRRFPGRHEIFLLTGADNLAILHQWKDVGKITKICRFIAAARPGAKKRNVPGIQWLEIPRMPVSATEIRARARRGRSLRSWVPAAVERFIKRQGLYKAEPGDDACS